MLVIVVLLLLLAALFYPAASVFFARLRLFRRLLAEAKEKGYRTEGSFWGMLTAKNRSDRYELLLVRDDRLIAVKLWAAYRRSDFLLLTDRGRVAVCPSGRKPIDTGKGAVTIRQIRRARAVPRTRLPKTYAERTDICRVLLVYPSYREIVFGGKDGKRTLNSGDTVFDKILCTPFSFRRRFLADESAEEEEAECRKKEEEAVDGFRQNTKT